MGEYDPQGGPQTPEIQKPKIQTPLIQGASGPSPDDLSQFAGDQEDDADGLEERENLRKVLTAMGFPDLPATKTDLQNYANKMVQLNQQIDAAIKELQGSGADMAGAGNIAGPPDPAVATKIAALNDLQTQLNQAADQFQNYAYAYFSDTTKPLTLSQATITRAYGEGLIDRKNAAARLAAQGLNETDIGILLGLEDKQNADANKGKTLDAGTILDAYGSGALARDMASTRLQKLGYSYSDVSTLLKMADLEKKKKENKGGGSSGTAARPATRSASRPYDSGASTVTQTTTTKIDTSAMAAELLKKARER